MESVPDDIVWLFYELLNLRDCKRLGLTSKRQYYVFLCILPSKTNFRDAEYKYDLSRRIYNCTH